MQQHHSWDFDLPILEGIYADDALMSPFKTACEVLSHRTPSTISCYASIHGFTRARRERLGKITRTPRGSGAARPTRSAEEQATVVAERAQRKAERHAEALRIAAQRKAERLGVRSDSKAARQAEALRVAEERKATRKLERARLKAQRKRDRKREREQARETKIREAENVNRITAATAAADVAKAAIAKADRLAREAGIAPLVVVGRPAPIAAVSRNHVVQPLTVVAGECNLGDREYVRKRLAHTRDRLSVELRRPQAVIERCIRDIASAALDNVNIGGGVYPYRFGAIRTKSRSTQSGGNVMGLRAGRRRVILVCEGRNPNVNISAQRQRGAVFFCGGAHGGTSVSSALPRSRAAHVRRDRSRERARHEAGYRGGPGDRERTAPG